MTKRFISLIPGEREREREGGGRFYCTCYKTFLMLGLGGGRNSFFVINHPGAALLSALILPLKTLLLRPSLAFLSLPFVLFCAGWRMPSLLPNGHTKMFVGEGDWRVYVGVCVLKLNWINLLSDIPLVAYVQMFFLPLLNVELFMLMLALLIFFLFKMGHSRPLFLYFCLSNTQLTEKKCWIYK